MNFSKFLLRCAGWRVLDLVPDEPKCVICVAPHTSNWDFIVGKLAYNALERNASFLMKKEWFRFPLGSLFRSLGGIPVDRSKKTSVTDQLAEVFRTRSSFQLAITPEGTRKPNPDWKKGFYYIALKANVPIHLAYLDYGRKEAGVGARFIPTGDEQTDIEQIKAFYKDKQGKKPANFVL